MSSIGERCTEIQERIQRAAQGRSVKLIGVTKTVPPERIAEAYRAGVRIFGENRVQEALPKIQSLSGLQAEWHFIGHLQTNKAREVIRHFAMIQSIGSRRLLEAVAKEAAKQQRSIDALLELNLGGEDSKSGMAEAELQGILESATSFPQITLRGLMIVPPFLENPEEVRPYFRKLRALRDRWQPDYPSLVELSMGMSHDFEVALQEGATMVRIGTALFGHR